LEDELWAAAAIKAALADCGYTSFAVAVDGGTAREEAHRRRPDLITADLRLRRGENGVDVAHAIARQAGSRVIYVTAYAGELNDLPTELVVRKPFATWEIHQAALFAFGRL
jgi:DNA-binding response OmpR family regulator